MEGASVSDERVRELAAEILAREEYAAFRGDLAAWNAFFEWLRAFPDWAEALRLDSPGLFWLMMIGLLGVAGLLLAHTVWTLRAALRESGPEAAPEIRRVAAQSLLVRAKALAAAGQYLEAARHVQLATLERLLDRGVIDLSRSETNRVLRDRLRSARLPEPDLRALLAGLERLEAALFRERRDDPSLYETWLELHGQLRGAAARERA